MKTTRHALLLAALFLSMTFGASLSAQTGGGASNPLPTASPAANTTATAQPAVTKNVTQKVTREGIEVEFSIEPITSKDKSSLMEGEDALVRFRITDTATRTPLGGVNPSAWISGRTDAAVTGDTKQCREKISGFLQGSLRSRPDVDLNAYYVLALNQEANISVIDPLLGFGGSKLLTLVMLKSPGEDWALTADRKWLFVSMPAVNQVAVVDTATWRVVSNIDAGQRPSRLALQPDEKYLWVTNDAGVTVIDAATQKAVATIETGAGRHELAFSNDSRFAFVSNQQAGTLSVVSVAQLAKVKDVPAGASPTSISFSPLSRAVYVASETDGLVTVVDAATHKTLTTIQTKPGLRTLRIENKGRFGFITNSKENMVYVFDASTNRLLHEIPLGKSPDQIVFSEGFAYIRSTGTEEISLIRLATMGKEPNVEHFPGGQIAPERARSTSVADTLFPTPEGNSMLVANPADRIIYYYTEGMAAPMGNFQNYRREPKAVRTVDRSLRESAPGVYTTTIKLPTSGQYDVSFLLDSPRIAHCFEAAAAPNPAVKRVVAKAPVKIEYLTKERNIRTNAPFKVRFKLLDAETGQAKADLKDVRVLTFLSPGIWQKRDIAQSVGEGVYEITLNVPQAGYYMVFIESQTLGVKFRDLPYLSLQATSAPATADASKQTGGETKQQQ
ncbi:MAG TPA: cytochrome D1 domain-containing protein [Pyrinomonadaceae bacterium]|nr:cytochrome D1 domain-containing protein [Pyrinomonadaceae bacterium]